MEDYVAHEESYKGFIIKIIQDTDCQINPNEENDDVVLVAYHRDFWIEMKDIIDEETAKLCFPFRGSNVGDLTKKWLLQHVDEMDIETVRDVFRKYHVFGLEAYIHSGVHLSLSYEGNYPDRRWDVSQLGLVLVERKHYRTHRKALKTARGVLEYWNDILGGNVWGFTVEDSDGEHVDSCWGFVGDYKYCLDEAKSSADYEFKKLNEEHQNKLKEQIRNHVPFEYRQANPVASLRM